MAVYQRVFLLLGFFLIFVVTQTLGQCPTKVTVTPENNGVICSGNSIALTANVQDGTGPFTYVWSTGETTQTIQVNRGGSYTVTVTNGTETCQPAQTTLNITEVASPGAPTANGAVVCSNTPATLVATGPGGDYRWYTSPTETVASGTGATFITPPIQARTIYYLETTLNGCVSPRTPVVIELTGTPQVPPVGICAGNTATLKAFGGTSYTWYETETSTDVLSTGDTFTTPILSASKVYYVVAVINNCTSSRTPGFVQVTPFPDPPTTADLVICTGNKANLHAEANGIIEWYNVPNGGTPLITSPDYTTPVLTATTTYWVQNKVGDCVSQRRAVTITVNPIPDAPSVAPVAPVCAGTAATLTASSPLPGATFNWYADAAGTALLFTGNPFTTGAINANTTLYAQTVNGGCASALTPVQVNITDRPPTPTYSVTPVCPNTASTLRALTPGGTYEWFDTPTATVPVFTGDTFVTPPLATERTYYLQTTVNGCASLRVAVKATLLPPAPIPIANDAQICSGDVATLVASGSDNYQWYDAATGGTLITAGRVFITNPLTATTTFYVQTIVNGCASERKPVVVTVNPQPTPPVVSGTLSAICPGSTATITASVPAGGNLVWLDFFGNEVATGNSYTTPILYESTNYYLENRVGTCVSSRTTVTVPVEPIYYPQFQYTSGTFCKSGPNPIPTINDTYGGTFSAPSGLRFVSNTTGEIDVANSLPGTYTVRFVGNETCRAITESPISIVISPKAGFSYRGPYCQYADVNPSPRFEQDATGGSFTASPAGLVFLDGTAGVIDLKKSQPGTYTVTNTIPPDGTCPETVATAQVVISPGVTVYAGPDQRVKTGQTVQLAGDIPVVIGSTWSGGTGTFSDVRDKRATYTPGPGETSAVLTLRSDNPPGNCGAKSDQVRIIFDPKPSGPIVEPASICVGTGTTLSATAPGGSYAWFDVPTGGTQRGSGPNFTTPALTTTTTYYVQTTIGANTSDRVPVTVTVNNIPPEPSATAARTCYNTAAILTASGSTGTYEWYNVPTGGTRLGTGTTFTTPVLQNNISYYVQAMAGACASARYKVDVMLERAPVITSAATGAICTSSLLTYNITSDMADAVYTWERPAVTGISNPPVASHTSGVIEESLINTTTAPIDVYYNITATGNNCSTTFQYKLTVNPGANLTSPATFEKCNALPIDYTAEFSTPVTDFTWTREAVEGISNAPVSGQAARSIREILYNSTNRQIPVIYKFTYTSGNCISTTNLTATINPTVLVTSNTNPTSACDGKPFTYTIESNIPGATFTWTRARVDGISNPEVTNGNTATINETLINTTGHQVNVVYFLYANAFRCQSPLAALVVAVYPIPPQPVANSNSPVCLGKTIRLQTPPIPNASYRWAGPNNFASNLQNPEIPNASHTNAGTYSLFINLNGCESPAGTTNVEVNDPPTANAGPDQTICKTVTDVILHGVINGGTSTGIWTGGTGTFTSAIDVRNAIYHPTDQDKANGSVVLKLTSTSRDDCDPATDEVVITFAPTPAVDAGADREVCSQDVAVPLAGKSIKPGPVRWSGGTGTFQNANSLTATYVPTPDDIRNGSVTLTLHYIDSTICDIGSDRMTIKFIPPPRISAGGKRYVLKGYQITLNPTTTDPNVTYLWTPNVGLSDNTAKNPVVTGDVNRVYTLTVTDSRGCVSTDQAEIQVSPLININNTFTPNGDGINDTWTITGLIAYVNATVDVFDRYGRPVFRSRGYDQAWDGTYNGQPVPAGVYYYIVKLNFNNGANTILSGSVTVIR